MDSKKDWAEWHDKYDVENSDLAARLVLVQSAIKQSVPLNVTNVYTIIDICGGDARDIVGALSSHPAKDKINGVLIEIDIALASKAKKSFKNAELNINTVLADAADTHFYKNYAPADLVLLCGVFGNVKDTDVKKIISHLPYLCKRGGKVIWTRNKREPDVTPQIREFFKETNFEETAFITTESNMYAIGINTFRGEPVASWTDTHMFTFIR